MESSFAHSHDSRVSVRDRWRRPLAAACAVLAACALLALAAGCSRKTPQERAQDIENYLRAGDTFSAIIKGKDFIKDYPDIPESYMVMMMMAQCYHKDGDYEKTHEYLNKVFQKYGIRDDLGFDAFIGNIGTFMTERKTTQAIGLAQETLKTLEDPTTKTQKYQVLRKTIADYCLLAGRFGEGQAILQEMFDTETNVERAMELAQDMVNAAMVKDDKAAAAKAYAAFLAKFPNVEKETNEQNLIYFMESIVRGYYGKKDFDSAIGVYQSYLDRHPDTLLKCKLLTGVAFFQKQAGRDKESDATFQQALAILDANIEKAAGAKDKGMIVLEKGRVLELKGDLEGAVRVCKEYLEKFPTTELYPQAFNAILLTYVHQGNVDAALAETEEIQKKFPDQPIAQIAKKAAEDLGKLKERMAADAAKAKSQAAAGSTTGTVPLSKDTATTNTTKEPARKQ